MYVAGNKDSSYSMTFTNYRASIKSAWKITTTTTYEVTMLHALLCKFHFKNILWKTEKQSKYIAIEQTKSIFKVKHEEEFASIINYYYYGITSSTITIEIFVVFALVLVT